MVPIPAGAIPQNATIVSPAHDFLYHWAPPIVGSLLTLWVGLRVRKNEKARSADEEAAKAFRNEMRGRINSIRAQNGWFIRKFVELATMHNREHENSHITLDEYPNGYDNRND